MQKDITVVETNYTDYGFVLKYKKMNKDYTQLALYGECSGLVDEKDRLHIRSKQKSARGGHINTTMFVQSEVRSYLSRTGNVKHFCISLLTDSYHGSQIWWMEQHLWMFTLLDIYTKQSVSEIILGCSESSLLKTT